MAQPFPTCAAMVLALILMPASAMRVPHAGHIMPPPHASALRHGAASMPASSSTVDQGCTPSLSGYLPLDDPAAGGPGDGAALYYAYYEAAEQSLSEAERPILLWMQASGQVLVSDLGGEGPPPRVWCPVSRGHSP